MMDAAQVKKVPLSFLPTPLHELPRLVSDANSPRLFIKRDDLTGLAMGGNKARKLEYLIAHALECDADTILTAGAVQSNHCRQTAAAAAKFNLSCHLLLGGEPGEHPSGNQLLDHLFGAKIHWSGKERQGEGLEELALQLNAEGRRSYIIPYGGSNPIGVMGYIMAMKELMEQLFAEGIGIDHIIIPTSSCGTQAGLILGSKLYGFHGRILGISVDKDLEQEHELRDTLFRLCNATAERFQLPVAVSADDIYLDFRFTGEGYGIAGALEIGAMHTMAEREGILLDPVYTARAMGALLSLIQGNDFSSRENLLFWHTGGAPSIFAYSKEIGSFRRGRS